MKCKNGANKTLRAPTATRQDSEGQSLRVTLLSIDQEPGGNEFDVFLVYQKTAAG